jgi:hypothetical protein
MPKFILSPHPFAPTADPTSAAAWNESHPVGTRVRYWPVVDQPECFDATTRTPAWAVFDGTAWVVLVSIEGFTGGVALSHISPLAAEPRPELRPDNTPDCCPGCGHSGDGPWPWWDGDEKCPKCGVRAEPIPEEPKP